MTASTRREFARFLVTGGIAALVNMGSRYLLNFFIRFEIAVIVAYLFGMGAAYVLARTYVFEASGRSVASEFHRFVAVNFFALILVWSISVAMARTVLPSIGFTWHADDLAHFIGVMAPAAASYFGHRFYTFSSAAR